MNSLKRLWPYLKKEWRILIPCLLFASLSSISKLSIPYLSGLAIDSIRRGEYDVSLYLFIMGGCLLLGSLFRYGFELSLSHIAENLVKHLRLEAFRALENTSISYLDKQDNGDLILRVVNDVDNVRNGLIIGGAAIFEGFTAILTTIVFMFILNWLLGLVVVILTPISVIVSRFISKRNSTSFKKQNADLARISGYALESLDTLDAVQSYGLFKARQEEFKSLSEDYRKSSFKALFAASWINPSTRLVNNFIYAIVIIFGVCLLLFPDNFTWTGVAFSVGGLSAFLTYSYQYMAPFNEVADASAEAIYAVTSLERIFGLIDAKPDVDEGEKEIDKPIGHIDFKDVSFGYSPDRTIIDKVSFHLEKGKKIALVGSTGSGKTTIINLLMRFYDIDSGEIKIDGVPLPAIKKASLRSKIGMVLQETWLKHGTIRENVAFGLDDCDDESIMAAIRLAQAEGLIERMEKGLDTEVKSLDSLSTGERQLLCVARLLLLQPEIIVLDEATSNIDLRTEMALSSALDKLMEGRGSIVVAHRLSTIVNADTILVLDHGQIVESGDFSTLIKQKGAFYELYNAQFC